MHVGLAVRMAVGPLAALGFFLSWGAGNGPFAAVDFTGYRLVAFTGSLEVLVDGAAPTALLLLLRLSILAVVVAAVWHTLLAPAFRWHRLYSASGWYLSVTGLTLTTLTLVRGEITHPPSGVLLMAISAVLFTAAELMPAVRSISLASGDRRTLPRAAD